MGQTIIRDAARALYPDKPIKNLVRLSHRPRPTVRSWTTGHRRPPIKILKAVHELLKERRAVLYQLIPELEELIMVREREPMHARGFMVRDPLTGMDRRYRGGPKKKKIEQTKKEAP